MTGVVFPAEYFLRAIYQHIKHHSPLMYPLTCLNMEPEMRSTCKRQFILINVCFLTSPGFSAWSFWPLYSQTNTPAGTAFSIHSQFGDVSWDDNIPAVAFDQFDGDVHNWNPGIPFASVL